MASADQATTVNRPSSIVAWAEQEGLDVKATVMVETSYFDPHGRETAFASIWFWFTRGRQIVELIKFETTVEPHPRVEEGIFYLPYGVFWEIFPTLAPSYTQGENCFPHLFRQFSYMTRRCFKFQEHLVTAVQLDLAEMVRLAISSDVKDIVREELALLNLFVDMDERQLAHIRRELNLARRIKGIYISACPDGLAVRDEATDMPLFIPRSEIPDEIWAAHTGWNCLLFCTLQNGTFADFEVVEV